MDYDVVIVGAGTSGLISAYKLSKAAPQLKICVIEKEKIPGRKLRTAGNGKCNITNKHFHTSFYYSNEKNILDRWISKHSYTDVLDIFDELGIAYYEQGGYYYPLSNQGKQVVDLLEKRCKDAGVDFQYETMIVSIKNSSNKYILSYKTENQTGEFYCGILLLATGGAVSQKLGGTDMGYKLVNNLNIQTTDILPCLSPIYVEENLSPVKGVRINGRVSIKNQLGQVRKESGQIQFNDNNISGIVVMNLSNVFNKWLSDGIADGLYIDLLPDYSWDRMREFLSFHSKSYPDETILDCLNGILPIAMGKFILKCCGMDDQKKMENISDKNLNRLTSNIKKLQLSANFHVDYDKAQVTGGGVALREIDLDTFEAFAFRNLYILGELLDVNGDCGGYNISFAILSAVDATNAVIKKMGINYD